MTDQTTARDRAIRVVAASLGEAQMGQERRLVARVAVDTLLANPEVLRALAGAPTADVASKHHEVAHFVPGLDGPIWTPQLGCATCADLMAREMVPAAPEGAPTADVACDDVQLGVFGKPLGPCVKTGTHKVHDDGRGCTWYAAREGVAAELRRALDHWRWCWDCGTRVQDCESNTRRCCPDCRHRTGGALTAAPEGVDAADELAKETPTTRALAEDGERVRRERNAMAAELTAAQAAIQRVCGVADRLDRLGVREYRQAADEIRRALDGDTTEEER